MTLAAVLATLTLAGYAAWYVALCVIAPFGRCRYCTGRRNRLDRRHRDCLACDGTGRRVRLGRRLYEHLRAEYDRGTR
ncbi:hypothetical protein [Polymorphospora sp. NPDC050346]|uniref:hypothetical protein n=1 Tax=Polymorphospora sp. NPDC050346 TaxID=3155780 RepID=UPI003411005C